MKRTLTAVLTIFLTGASPTFAADAPGIGLMPSSGARSHDFRDHGRFHRRWTPGFVWVGYGRDPLWSWDDGFFRDLQYRHYRYGYRPYRRHYSSGAVDVVNGEARYRYDRGYPYDHYDYGHGGYDRGPAFHDQSASVSCRTQWVWSDRDREEVPVRICS
ncbi:hypothetical protein [Allosphingosinicella sp.]|uniref:hypothetical protein n=1 Tax=Allosphingosinicella sp. TaxID=2823234 RepID=UPI002FC171AD